MELQKFSVRTIIRLTFSLVLLSFFNCTNAQQIIEGLHFATGKPVQVEIQDGKILEIRNIKKLSNKNSNLIIAPGFFDNQVNGFDGISFSLGGGDLTLEGVHQATKALWKRGVTTYLPTLTTNSREIFIKNFSILAKAKDDGNLLGSIPGYHLEGPYISPFDGYRGAHSKRFVRKHDWK